MSARSTGRSRGLAACALCVAQLVVSLDHLTTFISVRLAGLRMIQVAPAQSNGDDSYHGQLVSLFESDKSNDDDDDDHHHHHDDTIRVLLPIHLLAISNKNNYKPKINK